MGSVKDPKTLVYPVLGYPGNKLVNITFTKPNLNYVQSKHH